MQGKRYEFGDVFDLIKIARGEAEDKENRLKGQERGCNCQEKVAKMLEIPEEVVSDRPKITTVGRRKYF